MFTSELGHAYAQLRVHVIGCVGKRWRQFRLTPRAIDIKEPELELEAENV